MFDGSKSVYHLEKKRKKNKGKSRIVATKRKCTFQAEFEDIRGGKK
jgi:hypothetical protein